MAGDKGGAANGVAGGVPVPMKSAAPLLHNSTSRRKGEEKERSYRYHPYDPNKKPRPSGLGKKRKSDVGNIGPLGKPGPVLPPPSEQRDNATMPGPVRLGHAGQPCIPMLLPPPGLDIMPSMPVLSPYHATFQQLVAQYAHNQLQQQALVLQQALLLQQLQAMRSVSDASMQAEAVPPATVPEPPVSLPSPGPLSSPPSTSGIPSPACAVSLAAMNCGSPAVPETPLPYTNESESETPRSPSTLSLDAFSAMKSVDTSLVPPMQLMGEGTPSNDGARQAGAGVTAHNAAVDVNLLPLPMPCVYDGVDNLMAELHNIKAEW